MNGDHPDYSILAARICVDDLRSHVRRFSESSATSMIMLTRRRASYTPDLGGCPRSGRGEC